MVIRIVEVSSFRIPTNNQIHNNKGRENFFLVRPGGAICRGLGNNDINIVKRT